jgi:hypothetical protein
MIPELQFLEVAHNEFPHSDVFTTGSLYRIEANVRFYMTAADILKLELSSQRAINRANLPETQPAKFVNNMRKNSVNSRDNVRPASHNDNPSTCNDQQLPGSSKR